MVWVHMFIYSLCNTTPGLGIVHVLHLYTVTASGWQSAAAAVYMHVPTSVCMHVHVHELMHAWMRIYVLCVLT